MNHRRLPTFCSLFVRALAHLTAPVAGFILMSTAVTGLQVGSEVHPPDSAPVDRVDRGDGANRVGRLVRTYGCWAAEAPPGAGVPTRAVVTLPGQAARVLPSDVGFAIWLDGRPGVLHAFCR